MSKHATVTRSHEIDQQAVKIFLNSLPHGCLARKQDPDYFIDYVVEVVTSGEPTGNQFAAQVKGYEDPTGKRPLAYSFKTKHLNYYQNDCRYPVFLFLINVTTREVFWVFAQKLLKDGALKRLSASQKTLKINFPREDSLANAAKFKYALIEAERLVRDLHPGMPLAAVQKRKVDLERLDPRCSVQVNVSGGREQIVIRPKESFSFSMKVNSANTEGWKAVVERGEMIKTTPGEVTFVGMPLFEEAMKQSDGITLQLAARRAASIDIIDSNSEFPIITRVEGVYTSGTKFSRFVGGLPNSPLSLSFELAHEGLDARRSVDLSIEFNLLTWAGQPVLNLSAFDKIKSFHDAFSGQRNPKVQIDVGGVMRTRGEMGGKGTPIFDFMGESLDWLVKCRWLAEHFKVNPPLPSLDTISVEDFDQIGELHDILKWHKMERPRPYMELSFAMEKPQPQDMGQAKTAKSLWMKIPQRPGDFLGAPVTIPAIDHVFSEMKLLSATPIDGGSSVKLVLKGDERTIQNSKLS